MWKNRNKIWLTIIVAFVCMFGSVGMAFAAETGTPVTTESMEIRTGEKVGLRTISAVDKAYVEKLRSEGKNVTYGTVRIYSGAHAGEQSDRHSICGNGEKRIQAAN